MHRGSRLTCSHFPNYQPREIIQLSFDKLVFHHLENPIKSYMKNNRKWTVYVTT